ncbi:MAG: hypothetical protein CMJ18_09945 [Phycisphaeraceae bacterium]|nr:hypothetical protein [Phycisphaeraceae bacterium]
MNIGVEIGATKLLAVLGDGCGRIEREVRETADHEGGAEAIRDQLRAMVRSLTRTAEVEAIGVGFGGPVDEATGIVVTSHQVAGWDGFPLADWFCDEFGMPCRLGNDTDVACVGESAAGAGRGCRCVFYTNIGSGIGGALVREGELYRGPRGAMEFGHTWIYSVLDRRWDHVEYLCSGWAIGRRAAGMAAGETSGILHDLCEADTQRIDAPMVLEAWRRGDPCATTLMDDVLDALCHALCNVVSMLNPDVIVIGGGLAQAGDLFLDAVRGVVDREVFVPFKDNFRIVPAALGEKAVPVGALILAECGA